MSSMQQVKKYHLDRYEYVVYLDESDDVSADFHIRGVLIARCKCCRKQSIHSEYFYWIVCRDPVGYPPEHSKAGQQLLYNTLQHGPFSEQDVQDFMDKRIDRVEALKRER